MNKSDLLKELRARTQAGMKDCNDALKESNDDLEKAVDIIKTKGQNIVSGRENKVAAEGLVVAGSVGDNATAMVEVNCQTDFVSRNDDFKKFGSDVLDLLCKSFKENKPFDVNAPEVVSARTSIIAKTKENCVIRRWWVEESFSDSCKSFSYIHAGSKLGVIVVLQASSADAANSPDFKQFGLDLALQVAALNPLSVSSESISSADLARQVSIFETQLNELAKQPAPAMRDKIIQGKLNKWFTEVTLLEQESILVSKKSIKQLQEELSQKIGKVDVLSFVRCQVGEGIQQEEKESLAAEVAKLSGGK